MPRRQHVAHLDFHTFAENVGDLLQAVLIDVFLENGLDRLGLDRVEHLRLGHLVAPHHVELQLARR